MRSNISRARMLVGCAAIAAAAAAFTLAGDLNPPAGPVAPTMKTLDEIEPRIAINDANTPGNSSARFIISQPGSYYLTGNIGALGNRAGIRIDSNGVTIDLNGFVIDGTGTSGTTASGMTSLGTVTRAPIIRNGEISNWPSYGVFLVGEGGALEDLVIRGNATHGVQLSNRSAIRRCTLIGNAGISVRTFDLGVVEDCIIETGATSAVQTSASTIVRRNFIRSTAASTDGIVCSSTFCRVEDNNVIGTFGNIGISAAVNSFVARNTVAPGFTTEYSLGASVKHGPIITADGDLSTIANADHPFANFIY